MVDPLARKLAAAPVDDEPFTNEDRHLNAEANDGQQRQEPISLEEVLADFGLTIDDWERMGRTPLPQTTAERNGSPGAILF